MCEKVEASGDIREKYTRFEGKEEGKAEARIENAKNMIVSGKLSLEDISSFSGLPLSFVKELACCWSLIDAFSRIVTSDMETHSQEDRFYKNTNNPGQALYEMLEKYGDKREKNGMIKGESKVRIEVTKRMISRGKLTLEDIAVFSNFSLSSVKELAECSRMIESLVHSRVEDTHYYVLKEATRHFKQDTDNEGIALGEKVEKYGDEREQNGIEEGESKVRNETAKSMLASGKLSLNDISEYSGLPLSKLRELAGWNTLNDMFGV